MVSLAPLSQSKGRTMNRPSTGSEPAPYSIRGRPLHNPDHCHCYENRPRPTRRRGNPCGCPSSAPRPFSYLWVPEVTGMRNLKPLSSKWVLVAGTALITTAKHPRFLAMLGMTGYRASYAKVSLRGNDEKCQHRLVLECVDERLPAPQQLNVRLATPEGHHGSRLAKSEHVVSTQFTPEDSNRSELDCHALRNDLVGKSRPCPQLVNHRSDGGIPALQLKRRHPIAVVADEDEIAPSIGLPNRQVSAIHVNEDVRLRRAPQIYRTSLLLTPRGKTSMWDVRFNTANESDIQPWSPLCGSILPRSYCRFPLRHHRNRTGNLQSPRRTGSLPPPNPSHFSSV